VGANPHHDQKGLLAAHDTVFIGCRLAVIHIGAAGDRVLEFFKLYRLGLFDFLGCAVADKDRVSAPLQGDLLALGNRRQIDFNGRHCQNRGIRIHLADEGPGREGRPDCRHRPGGNK